MCPLQQKGRPCDATDLLPKSYEEQVDFRPEFPGHPVLQGNPGGLGSFGALLARPSQPVADAVYVGVNAYQQEKKLISTAKSWFLPQKVGFCRKKLVSAAKSWFLPQKVGFCRKKLVSAAKSWFLPQKVGFCSKKLVSTAKSCFLPQELKSFVLSTSPYNTS